MITHLSGTVCRP